jgi:SAM-dependent MidA family methyltransferase
MERLSSALLYAGEKDEFESVLHTASDHESFACRQQLKTLLYSFGESFNVLALWKGASA